MKLLDAATAQPALQQAVLTGVVDLQGAVEARVVVALLVDVVQEVGGGEGRVLDVERDHDVARLQV